MIKKLVATIVMVAFIFCVAIVGYAGSNYKEIDGFYHYHIQSGYTSTMYESFVSTQDEVLLDLDVNSVISTGVVEIGMVYTNPSGVFDWNDVVYCTENVNTSATDVEGLHSFDIGAYRYTAYMEGKNGVHFIMNNGVVYYR